ncbi:aminotransferase class IV [Paenibacillus sp.]|uniref:aminotransferase class IV n=1 Tax=Paenibacillus sp. TaxID=58172 RepID=UPI002D5D717B|nr:aminotransferase class IV [Paenibacillus sp.]HZG87581.1 aminotransferase class IV [Paenibacillus sp.]
MKLWWNGTICDESEAVIPVTDHGFLYGMGLFETFRTYGGKPFLLDRHVARLREGCAELRFAYEPSEADIAAAVAALLRANDLEDAYVRWSVSAGSAPLGLPAPTGYASPNVLVMAKPLGTGSPASKELHVLKLPRSTPEGAVRRKSFHYMNNILAKWELAARTASPQAEGLLTAADGIVVEGIVSNAFWAAGGALYTPSVETGCLPGVTREAVLMLAREAGLPVIEGRFPWEALLAADEAFVTNSVQELTPVSALYDADGVMRKRWSPEAGPITNALSRAYRALTARE